MDMPPLPHTTAGKFHFYSTAELLALPPPEWLIEGMFERQSLVVLYGPPSSGKSFLALDWALSVATGLAWHGHDVNKGPVVYVAGEGTSGVGKRVWAWMRHQQLDQVAEAFFLLKAPQLVVGSYDVQALVSALAATGIHPSLIVIDTLAKSFVGGDENSAKEMGQFVEACFNLRDSTGATVLVVHHTGKPSEDRPMLERGSSALRGAVDAMVRVRKKDGLLEVVNEKQKDDEEFKPVTLSLKKIDVGLVKPNGEPVTSIVLVAASGSAPSGDTTLVLGEQTALEVLATFETASSGDWWKALADKLGKDLSDKTFDNWRRKLKRKGLVREVAGIAHTYEVTEAGLAAIGHGVPKEATEEQPILAPATPPPL